MNIEDVIESLNRHIENKRKELNLNDASGHLVLQKTIKAHETFKAYKEYNMTVWFIKGRCRFRVLTLNETVKSISENQEETIMKRLNIELCKMMFNWVGSGLYNQIVNGTYNGGIDNETA